MRPGCHKFMLPDFSKTNVCHKNFYSSSSKNWVSALKHSGIRFSHVFGNTYGDLYHYAGNNPVRYMDSDGRNDEDVVREMIYDALNFIIENIEEDDDFLIANKLREMMNNGKIQIDDVRKRYETFEKKGHEDNCLGFFDPWRNTVTGERRNIIVIDIKNALKFGLGELIDTLMHEGCHAVQSDIGFITVDESNNKYVKNSAAYIEHMAYNIGFRMYNKFAKQNKLEPKHYFTYDDVVKILKRGNEK